VSPVAAAGSAAFSGNLISDLSQMLSYQFMRNAFVAGAIVSVVAGVVGYFVILRRSAFAAHALSHIGFAGAAGAVALSVNPVVGLLVFCMGGGAVMGGLGQRVRDRDAVIGIVLAFMLGLGVLFIALYNGFSTEAYSILFGEILGISASDVVLTAVVGTVVLAAVAIMYRPLLFSSVDEEVAVARRVPARVLSVAFLLTLGLAVAMAVQVVGVLLVFSLLVTPAAVADRLARRPWSTIVLSVLVALLCTWIGLAIGYYVSYPVSFFITSLAFSAYLVARVATGLARRRRVAAGFAGLPE
jgi:zinc/manganese transport system permease protein